MKITVEKKVLCEALKQVKKCVAKKKNLVIPALRCVLLEAKGEELFLTTTDLEQRVTIAVGCKVQKPGRVLIDATTLSTLVNSFNAGEITIELWMPKFERKTRILFNGMEFILSSFDPEDFPPEAKIEKPKRFTISAPDFLNLLDKTIFCVSTQDLRRVLHGVLFTGINGELRAVGTDGKRLSVGAAKKTNRWPEIRFILPKKAAQAAERLFKKEKELIIRYSEKNIKITGGQYTICSKITEGKYPDYKPLVLNYKKSFIISTETIKQQLKAVSAIGSSIGSFDLNFDSNLVIIKNKNHEGEARTSFKIIYRKEPITFSFNIGFFLDVLNKIKDEAFEFCYQDKNTQVLIASDDMEHVIMPMRDR